MPARNVKFTVSTEMDSSRGMDRHAGLNRFHLKCHKLGRIQTNLSRNQSLSPTALAPCETSPQPLLAALGEGLTQLTPTMVVYSF